MGAACTDAVAEGMKGWTFNVQEVKWPGPGNWLNTNES